MAYILPRILQYYTKKEKDLLLYESSKPIERRSQSAINSLEQFVWCHSQVIPNKAVALGDFLLHRGAVEIGSCINDGSGI
jgi:hypothetical protein